jgi:TRAP-type C4-dicarboxylate transport system permease small subunit
MKSPLEPLYQLTAALAAIALVAIAGIILADVTLRQFGGQVRSADDYAVFALAMTGFLGLGPTYRRGEHIRVGILLERLHGGPRRGLEIVAGLVSVVCVAWGTWWIGRLTYDSWRFGEVTTGLVPLQVWVPQAALLFGLVVLLIAMVEDLMALLRGQKPSFLSLAEAAPTLADR